MSDILYVMIYFADASGKMPTVRKHATSGGRAPTAREMWLQAVKGRARESGGNKKGMSTTKKTPNEYWVGTLRRSQGMQRTYVNVWVLSFNASLSARVIMDCQFDGTIAAIIVKPPSLESSHKT